MIKKTLFKIHKLKSLLLMGKESRKILKSVKTAEDYVNFLEAEQKKYEPGSLIVKDKRALHQANVSDLFCDIDEYQVIRSNYSFPYDADKSDMENAINIMKHLSENTFYSGCSACFLPDITVEILNYSYDKDFSHSINCRLKAIAFTDILLSYGIKAFPVCMISETGGCHFVVHVFLRESNRFIVCDPSFNSYFTARDGKELSLFELRRSLVENEPVHVVGYDFLGGEKFKELYLSMFIKDCLSNISTWSTNRRNRRIYTKPLGIKFKTTIPRSI